ncbi:MAG: glutamate--cysteine ligase [Thermodesulfobacteriota bacterium]
MDFIEQAGNAARRKAPELRDWEAGHLSKILAPFYSSADLRVSDKKCAVVDTNIFPAGFNNLSAPFRSALGSLIKDALERKYPGTESVLIVPEVHTRNPYYWENIKTLEKVLLSRGFEARVGFIDDSVEREKISCETSGGETVELAKIRSEGGKITAGGFTADAVLLNNDFSDDCPSILRDVVQPIVPPVEIGWHSRRKDVHFEFYNSLASEAAQICGIDPASVQILTRPVEDVDFDEVDDRERVALAADGMTGEIKNGSEPFVFVKSNNGTYGMAVVSVADGDAVRNMNAENRKKMRAGKSKQPLRNVVVQEGVPTALRTTDGMPTEPVLYMVETQVAGAFYRANSRKDAQQNLNSSGMEFRPFPDAVSGFQEIPELFSLCAKIAVIAAGYEIEKVMLEGGCE